MIDVLNKEKLASDLKLKALDAYQEVVNKAISLQPAVAIKYS